MEGKMLEKGFSASCWLNEIKQHQLSADFNNNQIYMQTVAIQSSYYHNS